MSHLSWYSFFSRRAALVGEEKTRGFVAWLCRLYPGSGTERRRRCTREAIWKCLPGFFCHMMPICIVIRGFLFEETRRNNRYKNEHPETSLKWISVCHKYKVGHHGRVRTAPTIRPFATTNALTSSYLNEKNDTFVPPSHPATLTGWVIVKMVLKNISKSGSFFFHATNYVNKSSPSF